MTTFVFLAHLVWISVLFGQRTVQHLRRTGDSGWRGLRGGALGLAVKVLFVVAVVGFVLGAMESRQVPSWQVALSVVLALTGFAIAVSGQVAMGQWWRIGVREGEPVGLVTTGPFRWVRNPIFTGMLILLLGFVAIQPSASTVIAWCATALSLYLQVTFVEEPHLKRVLGEPYERWAETRRRFI